jgi:hypothetical protein
MSDSEQDHEKHIEEYGDPQIASYDARFPRWLIATYIILPIWGVISFSIYWNGTHGWLDRGYWNQLQIAALTTFPHETLSEIKKDDLKNDDLKKEIPK